MPSRVPEAEARLIMLNADLRPVGEYLNASSPWECECLSCHEMVSPRVLSIKRGQRGCSYCAGTKIHPKEAIAAMKAAGYEPLEDYPGNKKPWRSIHLICGEIVFPRYNTIQQRGFSACKKCSKTYVDPKEAESKMISAGVIPQEPYPGKDKPWKCRCLKCNQLVLSHYSTIRDGGGGCRQCALNATAKGRRYSKTEVRDVYLRVNLEPLEEYTNTDAPLKCECLKCGNFPSPTFTAIRAGGGCRYCSEKSTSLEKANGLAKRAGLEPLEGFISGQIPWKCRHKVCGSIVSPLFGTILKGGSGCIACNSKNAATRNRFSESKAVAIMLAAGIQPLEPYVNSLSRWKCTCMKCGKTITPRLNNIQNGSGCIHCSDFGFQPDREGYFYLMFHPELSSLKVGIGGRTNRVDRIATHSRYGWILFKRKDFEFGNIAYELEQEILVWLRAELGLGIHLSAEQMPQGGHSETIDASEIDLPGIWAKVEEMSRVKW